MPALAQKKESRLDIKLRPGDKFGHYRIERLLGQGGMGAVYAAEDMENGRRVALKIMSHTLDSREARARFLREGRLAASINHHNSVYIFGTAEIAGLPVIAMELMSGGTLQEQVRRSGPLPITKAVDCILQVINGLEAAQEAGILHRDVKPSNCFLDSAGTVKIGDFGLSINTAIRLEPAMTATGGFMGTPVFSSPEQLRGDELTSRSDIYAVGVTLYYLLTGAVPFESPKLTQLIAMALENRPTPPDKLRSEIPAALGRMVIRCLEKNPEHRYKNYAELRQALLIYSSATTGPASLPRRFLAGMVDYLIFRLLFMVIPLLFGAGMLNSLTLNSLFDFISLPVFIIYYTFLEGIWGASIGKVICGLRVTRLDRLIPGIWPACLRAVIFILLPFLVKMFWSIPVLLVGLSLTSGKGLLSSLLPLFGAGMAIHLLSVVALFAIFITARRHNGYAGLHDLASGTRVILKPQSASRQAQCPLTTAIPANLEKGAKIGPYHILETFARSGADEFLIAYDNRLLRRVWIRKTKPETPQISPAFRNIGRAGRLRWLSGRRSAEENWDAWEALSGRPLLQLIREKQSWSKVRFWLMDLAEELQAAQAGNTMPVTLSLEQVWITDDGRAKLLDFAAPGIEGMIKSFSGTHPPLPPSLEELRWTSRVPLQGGDISECSPPVEGWPKAGVGTLVEEGLNKQSTSLFTPQSFLRQVAVSALEGRYVALDESRSRSINVPIALHAREFLDALAQKTDLKEALEDLKLLMDKPVIVSRARRLALVLGFAALPICYMMLLSSLSIYGGLEAGMDLMEISSITFSTTLLPATLAITFLTLAAALIFRGGLLMYLLEIKVVNRKGTIASRGRVFWRGIISLLPLIMVFLLVILTYSDAIWYLHEYFDSDFSFMSMEYLSPWSVGSVGLFCLQAVLTLVSLLLPNRSLQDHLAGTWLVPK
jgi:serine/threonine protein kinase